MAASAAEGLTVKVRATGTGYYDLERRRPGDVFTLLDDRHFSPSWMAPVDAATPERHSSSQQALEQQLDEVRPFGRARVVTWPVEDDDGRARRDGDPYE